MYDLLAMGRSSIDLYAHEIGVPITDVRSFDAYVGGCPTNVSVGASRLGLRAALLTAVGDDQVGDFVLHFLDREGVDTRCIPRKAGRRTSAVILTIQPPDRFPLTFYRDNCADVALTIEDVERAPVGDSRVLFVTGTGLSREPSCEATLFAAGEARARGATVVVDLDYRADQWPEARAFERSVQLLLRRADIAIGTEDEICAAAGVAAAADGVAPLLTTGIRCIVVKEGARGSCIYWPDGRHTHAAPFAIEVLNVLGAGDAFAAGFLYAYLRDWPLERCARFGNATGAIVVTRHGCANFMPTLDEVEAFVRERGGW